VFKFKPEVPSEKKISQPEYEVCDDYFFLEANLLQFPEGFAVWYVLCMTVEF
jgi:hypothetical protein